MLFKQFKRSMVSDFLTSADIKVFGPHIPINKVTSY